MTSQEFVLFALQILAMLTCAILFGQLLHKFGQPPVLGEMIGGIFLGPSVFGMLAPTLYTWLFQSSPSVSIVREASIKLGMLFFLFIIGLEVNFSRVRRLGRQSVIIGLVGTLVPIAVGVGLVYALPRAYWGPLSQLHFFPFALFVGVNLANSANPVIGRILMDLGLLRQEIGSIVMMATTIDDLINWALFSLILKSLTAVKIPLQQIGMQLVFVSVFCVMVIWVGRWLRQNAFHWVKTWVSWPTGMVAVTILLVLAAGIAAEQFEIHAFLGAFLIGAGLGWGRADSDSRQIRDVIAQFAMSFFAPIYFVSMGLHANFATHFDSVLVAVIVSVACISKVGAVAIGAWLAGMPLDRKVFAIGLALNARGATGVILAGMGLEYHVIDERIFVAMVAMALVTSLMSGPSIKHLLRLS